MIKRVFITRDRDKLPGDLPQSVEFVADVKQVVGAYSCNETKLSTYGQNAIQLNDKSCDDSDEHRDCRNVLRIPNQG